MRKALRRSWLAFGLLAGAMMIAVPVLMAADQVSLVGEVVQLQDGRLSLETDTESYDLVGDQLKDHLWQTVEVTGTVEKKADGSNELTVISFKEVE